MFCGLKTYFDKKVLGFGFYFETGCHHVTQAGLKLTKQLRVTLNILLFQPWLLGFLAWATMRQLLEWWQPGGLRIATLKLSSTRSKPRLDVNVSGSALAEYEWHPRACTCTGKRERETLNLSFQSLFPPGVTTRLVSAAPMAFACFVFYVSRIIQHVLFHVWVPSFLDILLWDSSKYN